MNKSSILRKLQIAMLAFGIAMGFVFPVYANFFVEWKSGMFIWFFIGCLMAGLTVGLVSFWFVKVILIKKLKSISGLASQLKNKDISTHIDLQSEDEVGEIVKGLNASVINIRSIFEEIENVISTSRTLLDYSNSSLNQETSLNHIENRIQNVAEKAKKMEK